MSAENETLEPAMEKVTQLSDAKAFKKPSKMEMKRAQQRDERRRRLVNQGVPEDKVDEHMAREDFDRLPPNEQHKKVLLGHDRAIMGLANDVVALRNNDFSLADAMEVNFKAFAKMMTRLGLSEEDQRALFKQAEGELLKEREKEQMVSKEAQERQAIGQEMATVGPGPVDSDGAPIEDAYVSQGATVFGDR